MDLPTFSSIGPEIWGRPFWEFLDAIVATYPKDNPSPEQRKAVYDLLQSLRYLLPCPICRQHYNEFIQRHPLDTALVSRKSFVDFYFLLKKDVALRTNKGFQFGSPPDLWQFILRKLKLVRINPQNPRVPQPITKSPVNKPFRVPARLNNALLQTQAKKGCGCGKK